MQRQGTTESIINIEPIPKNITWFFYKLLTDELTQELKERGFVITVVDVEKWSSVDLGVGRAVRGGTWHSQLATLRTYRPLDHHVHLQDACLTLVCSPRCGKSPSSPSHMIQELVTRLWTFLNIFCDVGTLTIKRWPLNGRDVYDRLTVRLTKHYVSILSRKYMTANSW